MSNKEYTLEEIKKHNKPMDLWIIISGRVYDVTCARRLPPVLLRLRRALAPTRRSVS